MKPTVVALFIVAGALVPSIAAQASPQEAAAPSTAVHSVGLGDNPVTDVALYRATAQADHDARLAEARAAAQAAADAAAAQAAADAAAAQAAAEAQAAVASESTDSWSSDAGSDSGDTWSAPAPQAAAAAAPEAAPEPTTPRPDNSNCGPCAGADLVWIVYDGVGYWACP